MCFDENNEATRSKADAVVQALFKNGGRLIDTASTYGALTDMIAGNRKMFALRAASNKRRHLHRCQSRVHAPAAKD
jgi:diketogulonate reductase-like aldo/keto reductase